MPLTQHDARRDAQARLNYEPLVSNLAYVFMARMVSGKASAGDTQNSRPANKFLREKPENAELVKQLLKACNKEHDPQQFVDAADDNYALRQGFAHNKSDAWLKQTAEDLRTVGALDIFQNTHPFQCMIIEHMDAMLAVL